MAILLYSNGITEEYKPANLVFTDEELVTLFSEYSEIKTVRTPTILNTWCIFGVSNIGDNYNKIASYIAGHDILTYTLFVHDSEINHTWNVTDNILYNDYQEFIKILYSVIEEIAIKIMKELGSTTKNTAALPQLVTLGTMKDDAKRILFGFNPTDQHQDFYEGEEFTIFSNKIYEYLTTNKQTEEPFTIYSDQKAVIVVESAHIESFLNLLLENFKGREEYEICIKIKDMITEWAELHQVNSKDITNG